MLERLHIVVGYVGSAALVAFVAACLTSPRLDSFSCHTSGANGAQRCELAAVESSPTADADMDSATSTQDPPSANGVRGIPYR